MDNSSNISPESSNNSYKRAVELASLIWTSDKLLKSNYKNALKKDFLELKALKAWLISLGESTKYSVDILINWETLNLIQVEILERINKIKSKAKINSNFELDKTIWFWEVCSNPEDLAKVLKDLLKHHLERI